MEVADIFSKLDSASLVLFDLDDTLYAEDHYLKAGYSAISNDAAMSSGLQAGDIFDWMESEFKKAGRRQIFQKLCQEFAISTDNIEVWIQLLRTVEIPEGLRLKGWVGPVLERCRGKTAILTNGNSTQQENKVRLLGIRKMFPEVPVYFAELWQPKPSVAVLSAIQADFSFTPKDALMIGDSRVDEAFARSAQMVFLDVNLIDRAFAN